MNSPASLIRNLALVVIIVFAPGAAGAAPAVDGCEVWESEPDSDVYWICRDCVWSDCMYTCYQFNCAIDGRMYGEEEPECWLDDKHCPRMAWVGGEREPAPTVSDAAHSTTDAGAGDLQ